MAITNVRLFDTPATKSNKQNPLTLEEIEEYIITTSNSLGEYSITRDIQFKNWINTLHEIVQENPDLPQILKPEAVACYFNGLDNILGTCFIERATKAFSKPKKVKEGKVTAATKKQIQKEAKVINLDDDDEAGMDDFL